MSGKLKIPLVLLGSVLAAAFALWYPYESGSVPEWKLQVVDQTGQAVAGAQINQEWLDPIDDGIVSGDSRTTDRNGFVLFPKRVLRNRLALGAAHSAPSSRLFVCWQNQFGEVDWDGNPSHLADQLILKKGACPYG
jgi:hypothetical protein